MNITSFGITDKGEEVLQYTLENETGIKLSVINYGGIITSLYTPGRDGKLEDIVLGYNNLEDYIEDSPYFGALVGRYGNRIANGRFDLSGEEYKLALNDENGGIPCHLHGGIKGFDKVLWDITPITKGGKLGLKLYYRSKDGEEGYPGNLDIAVYYYLTESTLRVEYYAETDKATPVNLTQHSYFNLKGEGNGNVLDHELFINADSYTPVNGGLIPTGVIEPVKNTPFDFTTVKTIGVDIENENEQLKFGGGYDHNYVLNGSNGELRKAADVFEPESGRNIEVWTTEPGMQFYSGNNLDGSHIGKSDKEYIRYGGFCLETQHYPDSPNQDNFPSTILKPGEKYESITEFRFDIRG
ncbi:MAG: aldose epimerase family protein [Halanaerobiales bacterium]